MVEQCLFCGLGKIEEIKIYEDSMCYAIMDKYPSNYGEFLIIAKDHHETILTEPDDVVQHMFLVSKRLAAAAKQSLSADGLNILVNVGKAADQLIFHFHIHVIPKYLAPIEGFKPYDELNEGKAKQLRKLLKSKPL